MNPNAPEDPTFTTSEDVQLPPEVPQAEGMQENNEELPDMPLMEEDPLPEPDDELTDDEMLAEPPAPKEISPEPGPSIQTNPAPSRTSTPSSLDNLDIKLTFEVGQKDIPLTELKSLQTGFSFEFDSPVNQPITIKANGKALGKGELIQIGDKVGVRVIEFFGNN